LKRIILPLFFSVYLTLPVFGQERKTETLAIRTDKSIEIDGLLNEPIWKRAPDAGAFVQLNPDRREPQKIKTSAKILYDDNFIYIGFLCSDTEPDKIEAEATRIDGDLRGTDSIYILVDAFHDRENFYFFATNFLGARSDGRISRDGQIADYRWNGSWKSSSQKTDFGWSTEVAIELSNLFDEPGKEKAFGLSLSRIVPRLDSVFWKGPLDPAFEFDEIGKLKVLDLGELDLLKGERKANFTPYLLSRSESGKKTEPAAGIDARYAFSSQLSGRLTINPDFATVEPDQEQVNLTPFELYLPEKREYFLEGSDIYPQGIGLFYSKRIGDIYGGVELNGNFGAYEYSGMSVQTKKDQYPDEDSANFSVFRLKRGGATGSSAIGFTAANKLIGQTNKGTAGIDADLYFTDNFKLSGQVALSYGDYSRGNIAFFLSPSYDSRTFHVHLRYTQIGEYFGDNANYVGFIPDDNRRELDSAVNKTFSFQRGFFERIRYRSNYNVYWGMDGTLRSWQIDEGFFFDLKSKFIVSVVHTMEYKLNEYLPEPRLVYMPDIGGWARVYTKDFRNWRTRVRSEFFDGEWKSFSLTFSAGRNYGSDFQILEMSKKLQITKTLFSEYDLCHFIKYEPPLLLDKTTINVLKITHYVNKNLFWKLFFQANSAIDKINFHVVFVYTFKPPFGSIQLAYQKGTARFGVKGTQGHTLFLKLGYIF
jgi:hypothetical protein